MEQIFVSSVQKELRAERQALREFVHGNDLLRQFFRVFLFEDLPPADRKTDDVYLIKGAIKGPKGPAKPKSNLQGRRKDGHKKDGEELK